MRLSVTLLGVLGGKNKLFPGLSSGPSPTTPNYILREEHGHSNKRGSREEVSACFCFHHFHGGTLLPSVSQNDTLLGVLGDKNKLNPRPASGTSTRTPNHVFPENMVVKRKQVQAEPSTLNMAFITGTVERCRRA